MNIFTSNPDFYPTPANVIDTMMQDETVTGKTILEPSAGKGDIVDWMLAHGAKEVLACENNPTLRSIVAQKCPVLADDFLSVTSEQVSHVDMIVMNPPFSKDMEHIMHAFDIAPAGCTIIALCNASHIVHNSYDTSIKRRFLENIELNGWSENIGNVFRNAERQTDVDTGLVKLYKPGSGTSEFDEYVFDGAPDTGATGAGTEGLISYDFIRDIVTRYVAAVSAFDEVSQKAQEINRLAKFPGADQYGTPPIRFMAVKQNDGRESCQETVSHETYRKELQKYYWRVIFKKMNLEKYATRQLREQINRFVERNANTPFTMRNIYNVLSIVFQTNGQRMESALCEAFDTICSFSAENSTAGEKWKTNSDYVVNRKFIVPWITEGYRWGNEPNRYVEVHWSGNSVLIDDIVKALCYFTGTKYDEKDPLHNINSRKLEWGAWYEWTFFRIKAFKKGTMHFEFLSEDIWAEFNRKVASLRGWRLPKTTKKSRTKSNQTSYAYI